MAGHERSAIVEESLSRPEIHEDWERTYRTPEHKQVTDLIFDRVLHAVGAPAGSRWLDVGCGPAIHALRLARHGYHVTGLDISPDVLASAQRNVDRARLSNRIELSVGNVLDLQLPDKSVEYILCWGVLMHVPAVDTAVQELCRVLRPGGRLVVSENNLGSWDNLLLAVRDSVRGESVRRVRTPAGVERWFTTPGGMLLTRQTDMNWLSEAFDRHGIVLHKRMAGPLTETSQKLAAGRAASAVHRLNYFWVKHVGSPGPAEANVLIFERPA